MSREPFEQHHRTAILVGLRVTLLEAMVHSVTPLFRHLDPTGALISRLQPGASIGDPLDDSVELLCDGPVAAIGYTPIRQEFVPGFRGLAIAHRGPSGLTWTPTVEGAPFDEAAVSPPTAPRAAKQLTYGALPREASGVPTARLLAPDHVAAGLFGEMQAHVCTLGLLWVPAATRLGVESSDDLVLKL